MKILSSLFAVLLALAILESPARAEGEFEPIAAELTDRAAVISLPEGVRRIRLRIRQADGTWVVDTIAHLEGNEGYLKLRIPDGVAEEDCEVSASFRDPFPYDFYQGASEHAGNDSNGGLRTSPDSGPQAFATEDGNTPEDSVTVEESDIWKWRGDTLYFFNQYRGLQVIEVSDPATPRRLASLRVNSYGEQMYLHPEDDLVILLTYDSASGNGEVKLVAHEAAHVLQQRASFPVPGYILESRLVGKILYVVSRNSWQETVSDPDGTTHVSWRSGLAVTKIDLGDPAAPVASPPLEVSSAHYNYWGAQVQATSQALLVSTNAYDSARRQSLSTVHVIDISDPYATPAVTHHLPVAGQVLNKFNMNLDGDILTVVSQVWRGWETRQRYASVETFDLSRGSNPRLAGIEFANNESITATRFVGDLLYVVTFLRIDPLFVVDLADPTDPHILSELEIPGFSTYLQPLGTDTLISIGVEDRQIAVSWFDVSDPTNTSLASRVFIGAQDGWSWTEANWDEKAFGFFPDDGLLLVPYQGSVPGAGWMSGVQLIELGNRELLKRGSFEHEFRARRARVVGDAVVSISGRSLRSLDISDRDNPRLLSELVLAWPVDIVHRVGDTLVQLERGPGYWWHGTSENPARLHVSPAADPDELLLSLDLPGGRIAGSLLDGDCLLIAQTQSRAEETENATRFTETFTTTVIDVGNPEQPVVVGRGVHESVKESHVGGFGSDYRGSLLPDGRLVWYPAEQNSFYFWDIAPVGLAAPAGDVAFPWYPASGRVFTFDISTKTNPVPLAAVDLSNGQVPGSNVWPAGEIQLLGSTLYYGLQTSGPLEAEAENDPLKPVRWVTRHWLGHLDLSDPAAPAQGNLVSVPGSFEHALATPVGGIVIFTSSHHYQSENGTYQYQFRIQASAFDGLKAFLLDEITPRESGYGGHIFHERFLALTTIDHAAEDTELAIYEWRNHGSFAELRSATLAGFFHRLAVNDDLLIASESSALTFIDFADPADPAPASVSFPGTNFWSRAELINVHQRERAYLPRGFYGVEELDFGGAFAHSVPAPAPSPSQSPDPEWREIPFEDLTRTPAGSALLIDALDPDASWIYRGDAALVSYESWTRQALGLPAGAPVPFFLADSDLDGKSNGWEYFTGTDPGDARDFATLRVAIETGTNGERHLTGYLPINPHGTGSLRAIPRASFDLATWDASPEAVEVRAEPFLTGIRLRTTTPVAESGAGFLQVKLETATP